MFEWITRATFSETSAEAHAVVPADAPIVADHFPGHPMLPGTLQLELCAQLAGPLAEKAVLRQLGLERWAVVGMVKSAVFLRAVELPAELLLHAELVRVESNNVVVAANASIAGAQVCRADLVMMLRDADASWADAIASARARLARWTSST